MKSWKTSNGPPGIPVILVSTCFTVLMGDVKGRELGTIGTKNILHRPDRLNQFLTFACCENAFQDLKYYTSEETVTFICSCQKKKVPFVCSLPIEWPFPLANLCLKNTCDCFPLLKVSRIFQICLINGLVAFKMTWENTCFCRFIFSWPWSSSS